MTHGNVVVQITRAADGPVARTPQRRLRRISSRAPPSLPLSRSPMWPQKQSWQNAVMWRDARGFRTHRGKRQAGRLRILSLRLSRLILSSIPLVSCHAKLGRRDNNSQDCYCRQQGPTNRGRVTLLLPTVLAFFVSKNVPEPGTHPGLETLVSQEWITSYITSQTTLRTWLPSPTPIDDTQCSKGRRRKKASIVGKSNEQIIRSSSEHVLAYDGADGRPDHAARGTTMEGEPIWREPSGETTCFGRTGQSCTRSAMV